MTDQVSIQKKMSIRGLLGAKPTARAIPEGNEEIYLVRVWGIASGLKSGSSDFGEWTALTGDFKGCPLKTGEISRSGVLFVPDVLLDLIQPRVEQGQVVEFAFELGIRAESDSATGYVYVCRPLVDTPTSDVMAALDAKINAQLQLQLQSQPESPEPKKARSNK